MFQGKLVYGADLDAQLIPVELEREPDRAVSFHSLLRQVRGVHGSMSCKWWKFHTYAGILDDVWFLMCLSSSSFAAVGTHPWVPAVPLPFQ